MPSIDGHCQQKMLTNFQDFLINLTIYLVKNNVHIILIVLTF
jgi:hypothetical protein